VGRRLLAWSLTLPLAAAGILVGHAVAYRATGAPLGDVHEYLEHLPQVALVLATAGLLGVAVQQRSGASALWPHALTGGAGFVAMEHLERLGHTGELPWLLTDRTFLLGLALQAPVAWWCFRLARWLVRAAGAATARRLSAPRLCGLPLQLATPVTPLLALESSTCRRGRAPPRHL